MNNKKFEEDFRKMLIKMDATMGWLQTDSDGIQPHIKIVILKEIMDSLYSSMKKTLDRKTLKSLEKSAKNLVKMFVHKTTFEDLKKKGYVY